MVKKKTTRARLVERAAAAKRGAVKRGPTKAAGPPKRPAPAGASVKARKALRAEAMVPAAGAVEIPGLQMDDIQQAVRSVVAYVQQNPLAAAAVAIGVGVTLASMYWDARANEPGKARATG